MKRDCITIKLSEIRTLNPGHKLQNIPIMAPTSCRNPQHPAVLERWKLYIRGVSLFITISSKCWYQDSNTHVMILWRQCHWYNSFLFSLCHNRWQVRTVLLTTNHHKTDKSHMLLLFFLHVCTVVFTDSVSTSLHSVYCESKVKFIVQNTDETQLRVKDEFDWASLSRWQCYGVFFRPRVVKIRCLDESV